MHNRSERHVDYRLTAFYQRAVHEATYQRGFDVYTLPHRQFFGIPRDGQSKWWDIELLSRCDITQYLRQQDAHPHVPTASDVSAVTSNLGSYGRLPTELALHILELADYSPQRRLPLAHDPLHPDNGEELRKYLSYCWKLLLRCDALALACGYRIDWEGEIRNCIFTLTMDYRGVERRIKWRHWEEADLEEEQRTASGELPTLYRRGFNFRFR